MRWNGPSSFFMSGTIAEGSALPYSTMLVAKARVLQRSSGFDANGFALQVGIRIETTPKDPISVYFVFHDYLLAKQCSHMVWKTF